MAAPDETASDYFDNVVNRLELRQSRRADTIASLTFLTRKPIKFTKDTWEDVDGVLEDAGNLGLGEDLDQDTSTSLKIINLLCEMMRFCNVDIMRRIPLLTSVDIKDYFELCVDFIEGFEGPFLRRNDGAKSERIVAALARAGFVENACALFRVFTVIPLDEDLIDWSALLLYAILHNHSESDLDGLKHYLQLRVVPFGASLLRQTADMMETAPDTTPYCLKSVLDLAPGLYDVMEFATADELDELMEQSLALASRLPDPSVGDYEFGRESFYRVVQFWKRGAIKRRFESVNWEVDFQLMLRCIWGALVETSGGISSAHVADMLSVVLRCPWNRGVGRVFRGFTTQHGDSFVRHFVESVANAKGSRPKYAWEHAIAVLLSRAQRFGKYILQIIESSTVFNVIWTQEFVHEYYPELYLFLEETDAENTLRPVRAGHTSLVGECLFLNVDVNMRSREFWHGNVVFFLAETESAFPVASLLSYPELWDELYRVLISWRDLPLGVSESNTELFALYLLSYTAQCDEGLRHLINDGILKAFAECMEKAHFVHQICDGRNSHQQGGRLWCSFIVSLLLQDSDAVSARLFGRIVEVAVSGLRNNEWEGAKTTWLYACCVCLSADLGKTSVSESDWNVVLATLIDFIDTACPRYCAQQLASRTNSSDQRSEVEDELISAGSMELGNVSLALLLGSVRYSNSDSAREWVLPHTTAISAFCRAIEAHAGQSGADWWTHTFEAVREALEHIDALRLEEKRAQ